MTSPGIDKVKLFVSDFQVQDVSRSGLQLIPGAVDLDTGTTMESVLLQDRTGTRIVGAKAVRNTELYNLTVTGHGMSLTFNPSKPYHPLDLVDDDDVFHSRFLNVKTDLEQRGIHAGWMDAKVTRLDVSRNVLLNGSVRSYSPVWPWLKLKRSKHVRQYPDGYGSGNNSWGAIFYDKGKESGQYPGDNLLRGELQYKRSRAVLSTFGCRTFGQVRQLGMSAIADIYRTDMQTKVLRMVDGMDQLTIHFQNEIEVIKQLRHDNDRTAVVNYFLLMSVPTFLERYGPNGVDVFADVLHSAGFSRMSVSRSVKVLRERVLLYDRFYRDQQNTVGKLLRELVHKIAA